MIKKILVSMAFLFATIFVGADTFAELNWPENPYGSESVVKFNDFIDTTSLAEYKGWGVEMNEVGECVTGAGSQNSAIPMFNGYPYLEEKNTQCLSNKYVSFYSNEEARTSIKESDFARGRICGLNDCNGSDPVLSTGIESNRMQVVGSFIESNSRIVNGSGQLDNDVWTADIYKNNFSSFQKYYNTLPETLEEGDIVRVFVYLHNNAEQEVVANQATGVNVNVSWTGGVVTSTIDSDQTNVISDTFNYSLPTGLSFVPKVNAANEIILYRNGQGAISDPVIYNGGNSFDVPMSTVASSYGGVQRLYVDFEVTTQESDMEFEKWARTEANGEWHKASTVSAGEVYEYRVWARNTGTSDIEDVVVTDPLDTNLTYVSAATGDAVTTHDGTNPGGVVTMEFGTVVGGVTEEQIFSVEVADPIAAGTVIPNTIYDNQGYCVDEDGDGVVDNTDNEEDCNTVHTVPSDMEFEKWARTEANGEWHKASTVSAGEVYEYRVWARNTGTSDIEDVVVTDPLDTNLTYVSAATGDAVTTHDGTNPGGVVTMEFGTVAGGETEEQIFSVEVADPIGAGTEIPNTIYDNQGYCVDEDGDGVVDNTDNEEDCNTVHTVPSSMEFEKWARTEANGEWHKAGTVSAGEVYEYRVWARNTGTSDIEDVVVTDPLDTNLTYVSAATGDAVTTHDGATTGGVVTMEFGTVAAGVTEEQIFSVEVADPIAAGTEIPNTIFDNQGYCVDEDGDGVVDNTDNEEDCNTVHTVPSSMEFEKWARTEANGEWHKASAVSAGEVYEYRVWARNTGTSDIDDVVVTDPLDTNLTYVSAATGDAVTTHDGATTGGVVTMEFGTVAAGVTEEQIFSVEVADPIGAGTVIPNTIYDNQGYCVDEDGDGVVDNTDNEEDCNTVHTVPSSMEFEKWARTEANGEWHKAGTVSAGEVYEYRVWARNTGTSDIEDVVVTDPLDTNLTYVSAATGDAVTTHDGTNPGGVVTMEFGTVAAGVTEEQIFSVEVADPIAAGTVIPNTIFDNQGYCVDEDGDGVVDNTDNEEDCNTVHTVPSDMEFEKWARTEANGEWHKASTVSAGEVYEYRVWARNTGTSDIEDVVVTDPLDTNLTYVSAATGDAVTTHDGTNPGGVVTMEFGTVVGGVTEEQIFSVEVADPIAAGTVIPNTIYDNQGYCVDEDGDGVVDNTDNEEDCNTVHTVPSGNPSSSLEIVKQAKTIRNTQWHYGGNDGSGDFTVDPEQDDDTTTYLYKITVINTGNTIQENITVTDLLDSKISYAGFVPYDSSATSEDVSSDGTSEISSATPLEFNIGNIAIGESKHVVFKVKVETTAGNDSIPNMAKLYKNGVFVEDSNQTIHTVSRGGGGSNTGSESAGVCNYSSGGGFSCARAIPSFGVTGYTEYKACEDEAMANNSSNPALQEAIDVCLAQWISDRGLTSCDPDKQEKAEESCAPVNVEIPICSVNDDLYKGEISVTKSAEKDYFAQGDSVEYTIEVTIIPKPFLKEVEEGDVIYYKEVESGTISLNDLVVPSESGFAWADHSNGVAEIKVDGGVMTGGVTKDKDVTNISYTLSEEDKGILKDGRQITKTFTYTLKTELINDSNTCELTNVAFATAEIIYKDGLIINYVDDHGCKSESSDENAMDWLYSPGSKAFAEIKIVKPFVETKSGNLCADGDFGTQTSGTEGESCGEMNTGIPTATIIEKVGKAYDNQQNRASVKRLGQFSSASSNNGIYFKKFSSYSEGNQFIWNQENLALGRSETFIIENGDLIINSDLISTNPDYIPAFIVTGGNIIIDHTVENIHGVFIAIPKTLSDGEKIGGKIIEPANSRGEKQLTISGNLIGDAKDLFINRRHIGSPNTTGGVIEPSVKIVYDLRVFENTPPGLNNFLGHDWKQEIE